MVTAPVERSEVRGHRQRSENLQHCQWRRLLSLAQRCRRCGVERSAEFGSVNHFRCSHAREAGADTPSSVSRPTRAKTDPLGRLGGAVAAGRRRPFVRGLFSGIGSTRADSGPGRRWSSGGRRPMMMSASPGRGGGDGDGAGRAQRGTGSSTTDRKICSTVSGALSSRSLSAAAAAARKDQRNLAALTTFAALTRAREAGRFQRPRPDRPAGPPGRCCGCWPTSPVLFSGICCSADSGRRWSSGDRRPMMMSASPGRAAAMVTAPVERSEVRGHRQRSANSAALTVGRLPRSLSAAALRLGKISGIWQR